MTAEVWSYFGAVNGGRGIDISVDDGAVKNHGARNRARVASANDGARNVRQCQRAISRNRSWSLDGNEIGAVSSGFTETHLLLVIHYQRTSHGVAAGIYKLTVLGAPGSAIPDLEDVAAAAGI